MGNEFDFTPSANPYDYPLIPKIDDNVAGVSNDFRKKVITPEPIEAPEDNYDDVMETANDVVGKYAGPLTAATGVTYIATDPRIRQATRILKAAYNAQKPMTTAVRAVPLALGTIGNQVIVDSVKGMDLPFLITLGMLGTNVVYDKATSKASDSLKSLTRTAADLGLIDGNSRLLVGKHKPFWAAALGAGGWAYNKFFEDEENK